MATYTPNLNLKKPSRADGYNIDDFNNNSDLLDTKIASMVTKVINQTLPNTGWANSGVTAYPRRRDFNISGLLSTDFVKVGIAIASQAVAEEAGLSASLDSHNGYIRFYAKKDPAASITFDYLILR